MTKMNPVDSGFRRPLDGAADRNSMTNIIIAAIGVAVFVAGGVMFYSWSSSPSTTVTKNTPAIEQSVPPATIGQGGAQSKMPAVKDGAQ